MSASSRTARSRSAAERSTRPAAQPRPELRVSTGKEPKSAPLARRMTSALASIRPSRMRLIRLVGALVFLMASLIGSLVLRTQMVEDSFAITDTQQSIARLTQDIQERQSKLDALEASLPDKAQKLGMVPGSDALTIDLNGYTPSGGNAGGTTKGNQ